MRKLEIRSDDKPNVLLAAVAEMTRSRAAEPEQHGHEPERP